MIPYQKAITNKISRLLAKYNIKTVHIPRKKNIHMLRPVKDDLGLKVPGMYRIPCECGKVYVGQTGRSIEARCKAHMRHVCLKQPDKSAVAEHNFNTGHRTDFSSTSVLDKTTGYMDCIVKEATEIQLNTGNFNRDNGFMWSQAWYPVMNMLSYQKDGQSRVST
jgi:hypothetical protein